MRNTYILFFVFCLNACGDRNNELGNIKPYSVSPGKSIRLSATKIARNMFFLQLKSPEGVYFGEATRLLKVDSDYYILDRDKTKTVTAYDSLGEFRWQLNNEGNGPNEYQDIEDFFIDVENQIVQVYERKGQRVLYYSYQGDRIKFLKDIPVGSYWSAAELLGNGKKLVMNEDVLENGNYKGFQFLDVNNETEKDEVLPLSRLSAMGVVPESFGFSEEQVLFCHPFTGMVFKVDEEHQAFVPWFKIDFGEESVPEDIWKSDDPEILFREFERSSFAFAPFSIYFDSSSHQIYFYYYYGFIDTFHLGIIDLKSNSSKTVAKIENDLFSGDWQKPLGMSRDGYYMNMLHLSQVPEHIKVENRLNGDPESPVLFIYQINPLSR